MLLSEKKEQSGKQSLNTYTEKLAGTSGCPPANNHQV